MFLATRAGPAGVMISIPRRHWGSRQALFKARRRIAELEGLNQELEATNRNYMEVLGFVAHELKNALTTAMLGLFTVKDGYLGEITAAQDKCLESVGRSLEDMQEMIANYLDLSRVEKGELESTKTCFPLSSRILQPVLDELAGQLEGRQIVVQNDIPKGKVVYADASLLKIVYRNLLTNAIKYGLRGGTIRLGLQEGSDAIILVVRNDSLGIAPDQIPLLFRKFGRLYRPEHADQRGTGLGLYICREIVEKHGGSIWADSELGEWVEFSFSLPNEEVQ